MVKCLLEEEKLAVCVHGYPALYNKAESSFHKKNEKKLGGNMLMSYVKAHGRKQNWLSHHSDQSITDARKISGAVNVLEHSLTERKRPKRN